VVKGAILIVVVAVDAVFSKKKVKLQITGDKKTEVLPSGAR
jgi:hypothetical protein